MWQSMTGRRCPSLIASAAIGAAACLLAACSGDDDGSPSTMPAATTTSVRTTAPSADPEGSVEPSAVGAPTLPPFGAAAVEPPRVVAGDEITIKPPAIVERICLDYAIIYALRDGTVRQVAVAGTGQRSWQLDDSQVPFTTPACATGSSADPTSYTIPDSLRPGDYLLCLEPVPSAIGCGAFAVVTGER
jgi:hypothetical protein